MPDPARIGPYAILAPLESRGAVQSYRALQAAPNRTVAVHVLPQSMVQDPILLERFHQRAKKIATLEHPNLAQILDIGQEGDLLYVVTEHLAGGSLHELLRQRRLTLPEALQVVKEVAKGLDYAHQQGVLHGDLNPKSILVSTDLKTVKLANLGVSRIESGREGETITTDQMTLGLFHYLAPEQTEHPERVDQRADLYSLGVLFYELLTGRVPVGKFNLPSQLNSDLRSEVDPIVLKCLAEDPSGRYPSARRLIADLDRLEETLRIRLLDELQGLSRSTSKLLRSPAAAAKRPLLLYGAVSVLAVVVGGIAYWLARGSAAPAAPPAIASAPDAANRPVEPPSQPPAQGQPGPASVSTPAATPGSPAENGADAAAPQKTPQSAPPAGQPASAPPAAPPAAAPAAGRAPAASAPRSAVPAAAPASRAGAAALESAARDLEVARSKFEAKLYDQALADTQGFLQEHPSGSLTPQAYLLAAQIYEAIDRDEDAMAALVELQDRFREDERAPESMMRLAQLTLRSKRKDNEAEAARVLGRLADQYPRSPWAIRALLMKAEVEEREGLRQNDAILSKTVPAALVTYRAFMERYPEDKSAEAVLWKLGELYDELKLYGLAAQSYSELGQRFPNTTRDAWFKAAELYDKKLDDKTQARAAYLKVPPSSRNYKEAQKRAAKLEDS